MPLENWPSRRGVFFGIVLFISAAISTCASISMTSSSKEPAFGIWINKDYVNSYQVWRFVYYPSGKTEAWEDGRTSEQPNNYEGHFAIEKKWIDSGGNVWYRISEKVPKVNRRYGLVEVLASGNILEGEWSSADFPQAWGALGGKHYIYHRE